MAEKFERLEFTRDWRSASDFPTYEENEATVREDLQALHDETKEYINETLLPGIENLAVPGTGDMKMEVYDREGRREDVYQYAEERAGEVTRAAEAALQAHAEELPHVDAWTKEEAISAATREALNLPEDAAPDAALAKIAATPDIVMDVHTGKKYTVKAGVKDFGLRGTGELGDKVLVNAQTEGENCLWRIGDLVIVTYRSSDASVSSGYVLNWRTGELAKEEAVTLNMNAKACPILSVDGQLAAMASQQIVDLVHLTSYGGSSVYGCWNTERFWGYFNISSASSRSCVVIPRGADPNVAGNRYTVNLGTANAQDILMVDIQGELVYTLEKKTAQSYALGQVNPVEKTNAKDLHIYDLSGLCKDTSHQATLYNAVTTDRYAFFGLTATYTSGSTPSYYWCRKLLRLNLETWEMENLAELTMEDMERLGKSDSAAGTNISYVLSNGRRYIGSVDGKAYFWHYNCVHVLDTESGEVSCYTVEISNTQEKLGTLYQVEFAIPELPGVIVIGTLRFDTEQGTFDPIPCGHKDTVSNYGQLTKREAVYSQWGVSWTGPAAVTDAEILGMLDRYTLVGGIASWGVDELEEYVEPPTYVPPDPVGPGGVNPTPDDGGESGEEE